MGAARGHVDLTHILASSPSLVTLAAAEQLVAGTAHEATPGDRAERFHGDRSHARRGVSLTSRRRIGSIEKAPLPGLFP
jgi:hypothetical protein